MSRSYIWAAVIIICVVGAFLAAVVFGLLVATIFTLILMPLLLAASTVFQQARVARRERKIIAKMVDAATTAEGGPDNAMKHAAK